MSIESLYSDRIEESVQRQLRRPGPYVEPSFSLWTALSAGMKGPVSGGLEQSASLADFLSGFGTALSAAGGSGQGMFSVPTPEEAKQEKEARDRMLKGDLFDPTMGREIRRKADEFAPDPFTSHKADQVLHGLTKGVSKAVVDVATMGPAGAFAFGADEGNTAAQRLMAEGVDTQAAATVGVATGVIQTIGAGLPVAGPTVGKTLALAAISGPVSFAAQEATAKRILQRYDYTREAAQHDPLDPLGLALSVAVPGAVAGLHIRGLTKTPSVEDVVKHIESGGQRYDSKGNLLTSPKGAQGEMQVMPGTAKNPGFGIEPAKDNSPEELARVGRDYLAAMQQRYGDTDKALAAYNAGPGAVDAAVKKHGPDWLAHMPEETQKYVAKANRLLDNAVAGKGAADPVVVDAARVKVLDAVTARGLPDHPEAIAQVQRAADDIAAGRSPAVPPVEAPPSPEAAAQHAELTTQLDDVRERIARLEDHIQDTDVEPEIVAMARGHAEPAAPTDIEAAGIQRRIDDVAQSEGIPREVAEQRVKEEVQAQSQERRELAQKTLASAAEADRARAELAPLRQQEAALQQQLHELAPMAEAPTAAAVRQPEAVSNELPPTERPTIEPEKAAAAKSTGEPGAVDQARLKQLLEENPNLKVKLPGSDETITVEEALVRAHEQYDEDVSVADLVKVAAECALVNGG